jgi:zinc protease
LEDAEAAIWEEIVKLHGSPVTDRELRRVRTAARRNAVSVRESVQIRAQQLADNAAMYNDPNRINTNTEKLLAVTAAEVQRVAKTYLRDSNRIVIQTVPAAPGAPATAPRPAQ